MQELEPELKLRGQTNDEALSLKKLTRDAKIPVGDCRPCAVTVSSTGNSKTTCSSHPSLILFKSLSVAYEKK